MKNLKIIILISGFSFLASSFSKISKSNFATIITVVNTNDSGIGSLRDAITQANANGVADIIDFNILGAGPHVITLISDLPIITESGTIIDATTQPNWALGNVAINAGNLIFGLRISATDCGIIGLHIGFSKFPIEIETGSDDFVIDRCLINNIILSGIGIRGSSSDNGDILDCQIGTNLGGTSASGGEPLNGIYIADCDNLTIQNNLISGFVHANGFGVGLWMKNCNSNIISENFIGVDKNGTSVIQNNAGVVIENSSAGNQIFNNVISGNTDYGIIIIDTGA